MPSEVGLTQVTIKASPDRAYLVGFDLPAGDDRTYHIHVGDNLTAPVVPLQDWFADGGAARTYGPWQPKAAGDQTFLLTVEGDGPVESTPVLTVLDLGPSSVWTTV